MNEDLLNTEVIDNKEIKIYYCTITGHETHPCDFKNYNNDVNLTMFIIYAMDGDEHYTGTIHWPFGGSNSTYLSSGDFIKTKTVTNYVDNSYDPIDDIDTINFIKRNATLFVFCLTGILFETEKSNEEEYEDEGIIVSGHISFQEFPDNGIDFKGVTPKIIYKGNVTFDTYCPILSEQICKTKCETIRYNKARVMCDAVKGQNDSYVWYDYPLSNNPDGTVNQRKEIDKWIINKNLKYTYSIKYTKPEDRDDSSGLSYKPIFTDYNVIIQRDEQENGVIVKFHKENKNKEDVTFDVRGIKTVSIEEGCILECDKFKC